jgi:Tetracyclin repressor-like, C-terminal domain
MGEFLAKQLFTQLGRVRSGPPNQVQLAAATWLASPSSGYGLRLEPIASASIDQLVEQVAPALDRYLAVRPARSTR